MNLLTDETFIRLLLIEDELIDRLACRRALEQSGYEFSIREAETAEEGLRLARTEPFDCIVLDHYLPDFSGLEFLADFGEECGELPVPVVMLTCANDAAVAVCALKLGASDYVVKDSARESLQWIPATILRVLRERNTFLEQKKAMEKLREAEAKYRTLVEQIPAITYIASIEQPGKLLYISPQASQLGYPSDTWLEDSEGLLKRIHPEDRDNVVEEFARTYEHHLSLRCEYRLIRRDGRVNWFLDEAAIVRSEDGRALFLQGVLIDITEDKDLEQELQYYRRRLENLVSQRTEQLEKQSELLRAANANMDVELCERKQAEADLRASEARFRLLLESVGEGIFGLDKHGRCTFVNQAALDLFGYDREALVGQDVLGTILEHQSGGNSFPDREWPLLRTLQQGVPTHFTEPLKRTDGTGFSAECSAYPINTDENITGAVIVMRDVSEAQAVTQRLSYAATHDTLTGLLNRVEFERRVENLLAAARQDHSEHAVGFLDLDRFKAVNDTCGHAAGDQLLQSLGLLMESKLRQSDVLARLGGDEFGLLLEHCPLEKAWIIANELRNTARNFRFSWAGEEFSVGMSIGIVALNGACGDLASILRAADKACYVAKKRGRDRVHILEIQGGDLLNQAVGSKGLIKIEERLKVVEPVRPAAFAGRTVNLMRVKA